MKINKFEDLICWQKAQDFAINIYHNFSNIRDIAFRDQICRAAVSISNNIAEGFDRSSQKDFIKFLVISRSSCSETRSMLYLSLRLKYLDQDAFISLLEQSNEISKIIFGLIKSISPNQTTD